MPTSKLTSSRAFLMLLIAVCLVGLAPVAQPCPFTGPMSCCEVPEQAPAQAQDCCEEPEAPPPPPVEPDCPCAAQPDPAQPPAKAAVPGTAPSWWAEVPQTAPLPVVFRTVRVRGTPLRTGVGPPIFRRHCALLI